ncbi:MAG TPA: DUF4170 domain-containing protein [Stellaceae bacterium]|nr:DUF4170 domain-containing protein [Stellaceae bacterium]
MYGMQTNGAALRQFWVIGGEFKDTTFRTMHGPADARGPFATYDEALRVWRARSEETRSDAYVRYTIAANPSR